MQKHKKYNLYFVLAFLVLAGIPFLFHYISQARHRTYESSEFHSAIEVLGGITSILIMLLLYKKHSKNMKELHYPFIALAFLGMGIFDLTHAFFKPGNTFVFTHVFSTLFGGTWYFVLCLPQKFRKAIRQNQNFRIILFSILMVIIVVVFFPGLLPQMIKDSHFTITSNLANIIAGIGFLFGSLALFIRFKKRGEVVLLVFILVGLTQGASRLSFPFSYLWDIEWWAWHFMRFSGYIVVFYVLIRNLNSLFDDLNEANTLQQTILDAMPFGLMLVDQNKKVLQINESAQQLTGFNEDDVVNKDCYASVCPAECDKCPILDQHKKLENAQKFVKTKDKKLIPVIKSVVPITINNKEVLLEGFVDMTGRYKAEENLKLSEKKFREIFDSVTNSIFVFDLQEGIIDVNQTAVEQYGYSKEEFLKMAPSDLIHPDYLHEFDHFIQDLKTTGKFKGHTIDLKKDGTGFHTDVSGSMVNFNGKSHILVAIRDVSEKKLAEYELKNTMADLERSNKELEQFAFISSHDLQEPLRKIRSYADVLIKRNKNQLDEKGQKYVEILERSAIRMQKQINDLLDLSRISSREAPLEIVDLNDSLNEAVKRVSARIVQAGINFQADTLPSVLGDAIQLQTVFYNLISNAIKFRSKIQPFIKIKCQEYTNSWKIEVVDNGIGFDMKYAEKIFMVFQRLHKKDKYTGTGIGLTQCKKIIESHDGEIYATSEVEEGTTIIINLPKR